LGDETVTGDANVYPTTVAGTAAVGTLATRTENIFPVTGVSSTAVVGTVTGTGAATALVTGVAGTTVLANLLVWGNIVPSQDPDYTPTTPSQSASWSGTTPSQSPEWEDVAA